MLLIGNGRLLTLDPGNPFQEEGAVAIDGDRIVAVGPTAELKQRYPEAEWLDARGMVIMPGMTNTHMHLYSTFARGMALKDAPPTNFLEILQRLWWRLDKALTLEDVYYSALIPLVDCIKSGTTTILDHHASPRAVRGSLEMIARAARETGVRTCLAYEVSDRDGEAIMREGIEENMAAIKKYRGQEGLITATFGLHASFTLSDATLAACREAAAEVGSGFHIHVAEGIQDVEDALEREGKRVVERLYDHRILGPETIAAHCVHVTEREIAILKETGTLVVHNPESNMGNAVGCAPVGDMLAAGVTVGLGTDGYTSDMFESLKTASVLRKLVSGDPNAGWSEVPAMVFENNRRILARFFPHPLGRLEPGAYADVILVDYHAPTPLTAANWFGHLLFGFNGGLVDTTVIGGKVLMRERRLLHLDEAAIAARARELAVKVWERF
ncbi:Amidohydrolase 1 [Moorella glycerini]|uniref:5-methylthioadenosine/S-adenosylhomocysteine deaminase n=1 Tax=Neomoorella stamsii TaxID=1266720 RepID=A0A9X7J0T1_9FIRM|nr:MULTISPECIES: putative aminohydrolase SsnA [Moorella]PRR68871.1 5-methylthioadenosine/S-adenosylhomocysteine deaminase [Moorella stamsii]CEP67492.1 Amidohydrolase 1 [Moorella glycerini]